MAQSKARSILVVGIVLSAMLGAGSAGGTVTIDHTLVGFSTSFQDGQTFEIQVRASWDGQGDLQGIFASTGVVAGDPGVVVALGASFSAASAYRPSLFPFVDEGTGDATVLNRFGGNSLRFSPLDPLSLVRSVQYGSLVPLDPRGAASNVLVTRIFYVVTGHSATLTFGTVLAPGDTGALGDVVQNGSTVTVHLQPVPEPGPALLMGLCLAGLSARRSAAERQGK